MIKRPLYDESDLINEVAEGGEWAFGVLYRRYYDKIYAYSLYLLKSSVLSEEVVQEVFLKFWLQGQGLKKISNLESFLVTITRNKCLDQLRKIKLEVKVDKLRAADWSEIDTETEERIILDETRKIIQEAICLLPPQQKQVYLLCYQGGLKYEEAAKALGLSVLTVQTYMKLALKSLRSRLRSSPDILVLMIILKIF